MFKNIPLLLFIFFVALYFSGAVGIMNSLNASQYALTQAIVEKQTIKINDYTKWVHLDYAEHDRDKYSYRAPGESITAIPFYLMAMYLEKIAVSPYNGNHPGIDNDSKREALTLMHNAFFGALTVVLIYLITILLTRSKAASLIVAICVGSGTLLWRYSTTFARFSITGFFLLSLIYILLSPNKRIRHYIFFGGLAGCLILIDPSTIIIVAGLCVFFFFEFIWKKKNANMILSFTVVTGIIPVIIFLCYNYRAFGHPFHFSYTNGPQGRIYNTASNAYLIPLYPSALVNLFSNGPIPREVYPDKVWNNELFQLHESVGWSTRNHYNGIITQSPFLIFAFFGCLLFFWKKQKSAMIIFITAVLWHIQMSKFSGFYGPTAYDTHYFLPTVYLLSLGLGPLIVYISKKSYYMRRIGYLLLFFAICLSIYNAWVSVVTNFSPHVTGEHRFDFTQLHYPFFESSFFGENVSSLFIHTFPNIYNLPLLLFYIPLFVCGYILIKKTFLKKN